MRHPRLGSARLAPRGELHPAPRAALSSQPAQRPPRWTAGGGGAGALQPREWHHCFPATWALRLPGPGASSGPALPDRAKPSIAAPRPGLPSSPTSGPLCGAAHGAGDTEGPAPGTVLGGPSGERAAAEGPAPRPPSGAGLTICASASPSTWRRTRRPRGTVAAMARGGVHARTDGEAALGRARRAGPPEYAAGRGGARAGGAVT